MRRALRILAVLLLALMMLSMLGGTALAASPSSECEQAGGTFAKVQGTQTCTFAEIPGNNQGGVTKVTDVSQKGSSRSSHPEDSEYCVGNSGGRHCPGGRQ